MVTKAETPEPEPTTVERFAARAEAAGRVVIAGSSVGAVRRIVLYLVVGLALSGSTFGLAQLGLLALVLLIGTDDLR